MSGYYLLRSLQFRGFGTAVIIADSVTLPEIPKSLRKCINPRLEVIQIKRKYSIKSFSFFLALCWDSGLVTVVYSGKESFLAKIHNLQCKM